MQRPRCAAERRWRGIVSSGCWTIADPGDWQGLPFSGRRAGAPAATYCEKYFLIDPESPRWKQLFAYLTQSTTEAELDAVLGDMTLDGYLARIACPVLLAAGEYDPRSSCQ